MRTCPFCGSSNVTVISEIKSEKREENILSFLQALAAIILFVGGIMFIVLSADSGTAINYVLSGKANIAELLGISASLIADISVLNIIWKILKIAFWVIVITGILKLFLPYKVYSVDKHVCCDCEHKWEFNKIPYVQLNQNLNDRGNQNAEQKN